LESRITRAVRDFVNGLPHRRRLLADAAVGCILERNSDAMNPGARCRADRPCLEGSESRDRL